MFRLPPHGVIAVDPMDGIMRGGRRAVKRPAAVKDLLHGARR
jgi:hypothetical protein